MKSEREGAVSGQVKPFLAELWGSDSQIAIGGCHFIVDGRNWNLRLVSKVNDAITISERVSTSSGDVYFSPAVFRSSANRTAENASGAWAFWLDIDCGDDKAADNCGYSTPDEAVIELQAACKKIGIPRPSWYVSSGNGLHVYWSCDQFVEKERWLAIAGTLKQALARCGFKADPSRTADIASLLRVPGTFNFKDRENPLPVTILHHGAAINLTEFDSALKIASRAGFNAHNVFTLPGTPRSADKSELYKKLMPVYGPADEYGGSDSLDETPKNIELVKGLLSYIPPDSGRNFWRSMVWAVASLDWGCGLELLEEWSRKSEEHWCTEDKERTSLQDLGRIYDDYDPTKPDAVTFGSLIYKAKLAGFDVCKLDFDTSPSGGNCGEASQPRFTFRTPSELRALPPLEWHAKYLLPKIGLAAIYGPSGSGKSFLVLDLLAHIALGEDFYGHRVVDPCPVVYVALEGAGGVSRRIQAWEKHHGKSLPDHFRVVTDNLCLLNGDWQTFSNALVNEGLSRSVLVVDTLNQSAPTADENSSQDMGTIISNSQQVGEATSSLVILVHHTGKDASRGLRGHSSLHAALDAAIEVKNTTNGREWHISKMKDGEIAQQHPFRLERVDLGKDPDGDSITSCVVAPDIARAFRPPEPKGKNQKIVLNKLRANYSRGEIIHDGDAVGAVTGELIHRDDKHRRQASSEALEGLVNNGNLRKREGGYELV